MTTETAGGNVTNTDVNTDWRPSQIWRALSTPLLVLSTIACLGLWVLTALQTRPVNDDFDLMFRIDQTGFWQVITVYYTDFQGNISALFVTLLHQFLWINGPTTLSYLVPVALTFIAVTGGAWGALTYLGICFNSSWRSYAISVIAGTLAWLSLTGAVSPNSATLVFYFWSTVIHAWPFALALIALGIIHRPNGNRSLWLILLFLGLFAGWLGTFEGALIVFGTLTIGLMRRFSNKREPLNKLSVRTWSLGLAVGFAIQLASPAFLARSGGGDTALETNIAGVERLLTQVDSVFGQGSMTAVTNTFSVDFLARGLAPIAVLSDLILRPGLLAVLFLAAYWKIAQPRTFTLTTSELKSRLWPLAIVIFSGAILYSISGAFYAYAGRHLAGLALLVTVVIAGVGICFSDWWQGRRALATLSALSLCVFVALGVYQYSLGQSRAERWDKALITNVEILRIGSGQELVSESIRAGLSQSGVRDHEGREFYATLLKRWYSLPD